MKRITYTYFLFFVMVFSVSSNAQGLGGLGGLKDLNPLKSLTGGGEDEEVLVMSVDEAQAQLILALSSALGDVLAAQALIEEAKGNKDLAAKLNNSSAQMLGGNASNEDIQGAVLLTRDTSKAQQETFEESEEMADEAKSLYAMALVPYLSSVAKTAALAEPIANFMNASQNQLKSIRNPMEIRKLKGTLETGLFIGKNVPRLIVNLGKSSVGLLTFARKNGLDTSAADEIELDIEME